MSPQHYMISEISTHLSSLLMLFSGLPESHLEYVQLRSWPRSQEGLIHRFLEIFSCSSLSTKFQLPLLPQTFSLSLHPLSPQLSLGLINLCSDLENTFKHMTNQPTTSPSDLNLVSHCCFATVSSHDVFYHLKRQALANCIISSRPVYHEFSCQ